MSNTDSSLAARDVSPRGGAIAAAAGLILMAVIAGFANFAVIQGLTIPGDAQATAENLRSAAGPLRLAAAGLIVVVLLDLLAAWGLYLALKPGAPSLALLAAWFRVAYAAVFAVAITRLFDALGAAAGPTAAAAPSQALRLMESFEVGWQAGLVVFGGHLVILAFLLRQRGLFTRITAVLLLIAGAGYLVDGFGTLLSPVYALGLAQFTFAGEVFLIVWLFVRGGKVDT